MAAPFRTGSRFGSRLVPGASPSKLDEIAADAFFGTVVAPPTTTRRRVIYMLSLLWGIIWRPLREQVRELQEEFSA